jgi:uncharacterized Zn finger protein (UPF0148 family)
MVNVFSSLEHKSTEPDNGEFEYNEDWFVDDDVYVDDEFDDEIEEKKDEVLLVVNGDELMCTKCQINGFRKEGRIICMKCGADKVDLRRSDNFCSSTNTTHTTSASSYMPFRFEGHNANRMNKQLLKSSSCYKTYSKIINLKNIHRRNKQYVGKKLPKSALNLAITIFTNTKNASKKIFRNYAKLGVIGACLYYACIELGIAKEPKYITSLMGIEDKFLSKGDRTLKSMAEDGLIALPNKIRPKRDYIRTYFQALGIDEKYESFVFDIIERAEKKKLHANYSSRDATKCVGAIYLLTTRVPLGIKPENLIKECEIRFTTFKKYYELLMKNYQALKKVFKHHRIKMPLIWKSKVDDVKKKKSFETFLFSKPIFTSLRKPCRMANIKPKYTFCQKPVRLSMT